MADTPELPDVHQLPSVLETDEVNDVLARIADAVERNGEIPAVTAVECMVNAIFAQGYRPGEDFDPAVNQRLFEWLKTQWPSGNESFADAAITVLANMSCDGIDDYLRELIRRDSRPKILAELDDCIVQRALSANKSLETKSG